jgi:hypothetical protein
MNPPTIPATLEDVYGRRREQGDDHRRAAEVATHQMGGGRRPRDLAHRLDRARDGWEREAEAPAPLQVGDLDAEQDQPDGFTPAEADLTAQIARLEDERQRLSLDSISDDRARGKVADAEKRLAAAQVQLDRVQLARAESGRRVQQQRDDADRKAKQAARDRADALGHERARVEVKVAKAAGAYAADVAELHAVAQRQGQALTAAGDGNAWHTTRPLGTVLLDQLKTALAAAGAPTTFI